MRTPEINLLLAWGWLLLGFVSGMALGMGFHRENWLGGYGSHKRRLYRLAHISFFGLGVVNLGFFLTVQALGLAGWLVGVASLAFLLGAVSMPLCCVVMAHFPRARMLFSVPVLSLLLGGALMVHAVAQKDPGPDAAAQSHRIL